MPNNVNSKKEMANRKTVKQLQALLNTVDEQIKCVQNAFHKLKLPFLLHYKHVENQFL